MHHQLDLQFQALLEHQARSLMDQFQELAPQLLQPRELAK